MLKNAVLFAIVALVATAPRAAASQPAGQLAVEVLPAHGRHAAVIYIVPGAGVDGRKAIAALELAGSAIRNRATIAVVWEPEGAAAGFNFVTDFRDGSKQLDRDFVERVVPQVESVLPARPRWRAIAGYSAGGYSAMAVASRHPELFDAAGSFSGTVDIAGRSAADRLAFLAPLVVSGDSAPFARWGDPVTDEATWRAQNPTDLAPRLRRLRAVYIASGDGIPASEAEAIAAGPGIGPQSVAEAQVAEMTRSYHAALTGAGVRHLYRPHRGLHRSEHWRDDLVRFWSLADGCAGRGRGTDRCGSRRR